MYTLCATSEMKIVQNVNSYTVCLMHSPYHELLLAKMKKKKVNNKMVPSVGVITVNFMFIFYLLIINKLTNRAIEQA